MFVNGQGPAPAMNFAFPDVCLTPVGPVVVPIPYPNMSMSPTAIPSQVIVFTMCMPSHNLATITPMTLGDQPGVNLNPMSGLDMGLATNTMGSTNLFLGGPPATKLTSPTNQNGTGSFGVTISPAQTIVMSLR